jgi:hypothetical protein
LNFFKSQDVKKTILVTKFRIIKTL